MPRSGRSAASSPANRPAGADARPAPNAGERGRTTPALPGPPASRPPGGSLGAPVGLPSPVVDAKLPHIIRICHAPEELDRLFAAHRERARTTPLVPLSGPASGPGPRTTAVLITGGCRGARIDAALRLVYERFDASARTVVLCDPDPAGWLFRSVERPPLPADAEPVLLVNDLELAFPDHQAGTPRFILTQSAYLLQRRLDMLDLFPRAFLIATAEETALGAGAPEAFAGRGPWHRVQVVRLPGGGLDDEDRPSVAEPPALDRLDAEQLLRLAYHTASPERRLEACRRAVALQPDWAPAHLALAGAYREHGMAAEARAAIEAAGALAPDWAAVHYEDGKSWLDHDDLERARDAFRRAGELMPTFAAAFTNLGAALGEMDQTEDAAAAFKHALTHDPHGVQTLNNVGVLTRELGQLDESEAAFRQVLALDPDFVFGHYNLGHTLFLQGRYGEALTAYENGQRRDLAQDRRQGCRLGVIRFATGDPAGALRDLERFTAGAPDEERRDLWAEAYEIVTALRHQHPDLPGGQALQDRIDAGLQPSEEDERGEG